MLTELEILQWTSYGLIVWAILIMILTLGFIAAPYGRYSSSSWGRPIDARIAWVIQEMPSLVLPLCLWFSASHSLLKLVNSVLLSAFIAHYIQRTLIFPWLMRGGKSSPFSIALFAFMFTAYNGYLQAAHLINYSKYPDDWLLSSKFIVGSLLFVSGMAINIHSDHILRSLRAPGETGYKIPRGGMFTYISGANYFGEIVEWSGFAIACWSLPAAAFAIFTACFTGSRAMNHHTWYRSKFDDYPQNRKAIIPFIL